MMSASKQERIHVFLASRGAGSRRQIERWIQEGKIQVNGKPARLGQKIDPAEDFIKIKGKSFSAARSRPESVVIAVYKPRGVVSSAKDPQGRRTVLDLVPKETRLFPVGRLDIQSEGLILLTNDGDLANRLIHPRYEVPKVYEVKIRGSLDEKKLAYLRKGVVLESGKTKGVEILSLKEVTREGMSKYKIKMKVYEGKNHLVRKLFEAIRCHVIRLKRLSIGSYHVTGIPRGGYRILPKSAIRKLRTEVGL